MRANLNGVQLFGLKLADSQMGGWRKILRDERLLVRNVQMLQNTMRLARVIPTWEAFWNTDYSFRMRPFFDTRMWRKFKGWWLVLYEVGDINLPGNKQALTFAWTFLFAEVVKRKHQKDVPVSGLRHNLNPEREARLREIVLTNYEALTLG